MTPKETEKLAAVAKLSFNRAAKYQQTAANIDKENQNLKTKLKKSEKKLAQMRVEANQVREIPLEKVLMEFSAMQNQRDKKKWEINDTYITVNGDQFYDRKKDCEGGGAIDLVMHLAEDITFKDACSFLGANFSSDAVAITLKSQVEKEIKEKPEKKLIMPSRNDLYLKNIKEYLIEVRSIPIRFVEYCAQQALFYADRYKNIIFPYRDNDGALLGAEIQGSGSESFWRLAAGSDQKNHISVSQEVVIMK